MGKGFLTSGPAVYCNMGDKNNSTMLNRHAMKNASEMLSAEVVCCM